MLFDRDAAAIIGDGNEAVLAQMHLDARCMAADGLVHRVVDDFGKQVMQRIGIGAANIHAGATTHRLKSFQDLDIGGRIRAWRNRGLGRCLGRFWQALGFTPATK